MDKTQMKQYMVIVCDVIKKKQPKLSGKEIMDLAWSILDSLGYRLD